MFSSLFKTDLIHKYMKNLTDSDFNYPRLSHFVAAISRANQ